MTKAEYMKFHADACAKMITITKAKNADYSGSGDDPFSNFRQIGHLVQATKNVEEIGFVTRMSDKFSRVGSFVSKGILQVKDESVEDTLLDLANYCILFAGFIRSKKPKEKVHGQGNHNGLPRRRKSTSHSRSHSGNGSHRRRKKSVN